MTNTAEVQKPLSELSDFEINVRVGALTGHAKNVEPKLQAVFRSSGTEFNPCHRPEQAWPIIAANKITIEWRDALKLPPCAKRSGDTRFWVADENPLRAAMCVFLMMQEASHG